MNNIEKLEAIKAELIAANDGDPHLGSAINALSAAIDNLIWREEAQASSSQLPSPSPELPATSS